MNGTCLRMMGVIAFAGFTAIGVAGATDCEESPIAQAESALTLVVDRDADLGSAAGIADYIAIQGMPWDYRSRFESRAWKDLRVRTDSVPLINDEYYMGEGGFQVIRSATRPSRSSRGPLGPKQDLWLEPADFEAHRAALSSRLGMTADQFGLSLHVMPRTLSYNPSSPNWMMMSPADMDEWTAVMSEVGRYLAGVGWDRPTIFMFGEYENNFYGKDRPLSSTERARDHAELYIRTQQALMQHLPGVRLVAPATSTYAGVFTKELQQNPDALGIEEWLQAVKELDPAFEPSAIGWQGYYWYGIDGFGLGRLIEGATYVKSALREFGFRDDVPQYLCGWSGLFGNFESREGSMPDEIRVAKEAAHMASSIIEWMAIGTGQARPFQGAHYYTWNLDEPPDCGQYQFQSLVSTIHDEMDPGDSSGCIFPASGINCTRSTYQAVRFLGDLRSGRFIDASFSGDEPDPALRVAAVEKRRTMEILVVHRDGAAIPAFSMQMQGLQRRKNYTATIDTIQTGANLCASVASKRVSGIRTDGSGSLSMGVQFSGDGIMRIRLQRR